MPRVTYVRGGILARPATPQQRQPATPGTCHKARAKARTVVHQQQPSEAARARSGYCAGRRRSAVNISPNWSILTVLRASPATRGTPPRGTCGKPEAFSSPPSRLGKLQRYRASRRGHGTRSAVEIHPAATRRRANIGASCFCPRNLRLSPPPGFTYPPPLPRLSSKGRLFESSSLAAALPMRFALAASHRSPLSLPSLPGTSARNDLAPDFLSPPDCLSPRPASLRNRCFALRLRPPRFPPSFLGCSCSPRPLPLSSHLDCPVFSL